MNGKSLSAAVLAAGKSSRFGTTKQLAEFDGSTLVERAVRLAESACGNRTLLVAGHDWQRVTSVCQPLEGFIAINGDHADGIGTSIACAAMCMRKVTDGLMILLADQPLITPAHLQELVGQWAMSPRSVVASTYADTFGPPVIFPRSTFSTLAELRGDSGARMVIDKNLAMARFVSFEPAATDIDYPEDLLDSLLRDRDLRSARNLPSRNARRRSALFSRSASGS